MEKQIKNILTEKIMLLDGAMGTSIQKFNLKENDFRGERFKDWKIDLKGNNDVLSITRPDVVRQIHFDFLSVGSDIIETNTFSSQAISMKDYGMEADDLVYEMNLVSAKIAREVADTFSVQTPSKPRFVAGALGPTNRTLSMSPDVNNPGFRATTFDEVAEAYYIQLKGLVDGGIDLVLIETIFDTLNAKAAIYAYLKISEEKNLSLPLMISFTITDSSGRTLSGQTVEAFYYTIEYANPLVIGLNCALGGKEMFPYLETLNKISKSYISCYPNAGLPNAIGEYDEQPEETAKYIHKMVDMGLVNIVGGCCGTTKEHIQKIHNQIENKAPRILSKEVSTTES